jgi:cation-transporting ATPase E
VTSSVPFSSARKWAAVTATDRGSWLLGAPEVLLDRTGPAAGGRSASGAALAQASALAGGGTRVLLLGRSDDAPAGSGASARLPDAVRPVALLGLEQRVRPDAAETLRYFAGQDVQLKVISGDDPHTVAAVAAQVGVPGADDPVDARSLPAGGDPLADRVESHTVFGRVTPEQKRSMVGALRARGHVVAMTGDGVNDVLALKDADLGVAMGSGSPATRAVAQVVLLDNRFASLPRVLAEGRRVAGNVERVANLFLTKTFYALVLALLVGVARLPFPFLPRHLTVIATLTIGVPAFFLALAPNAERARPHFVPRVLRFAVPAGLLAALASFAAYAAARAHTRSDLTADRTTATITLFVVALFVLLLVARPWTAWKAALVAAMVAGFLLVLTVPWLKTFFALRPTSVTNDLLGVGIGVTACAVLLLVLRALHAVPATGGTAPGQPPGRATGSSGRS